MSRDRCKNRYWKKQLEHFVIKMEENQRFSTYALQKSVRKESDGRKGRRTQIFQCPSKSLFKLGVTAEAGAVPRQCHPGSLSRGLSLAVSTSSKVCSGESFTPHTPHCPGPDFHLSLRVVGSTNIKPPGKRGEKGTTSRRNRWSSLSTSVFYWGSCYCE